RTSEASDGRARQTPLRGLETRRHHRVLRTDVVAVALEVLLEQKRVRVAYGTRTAHGILVGGGHISGQLLIDCFSRRGGSSARERGARDFRPQPADELVADGGERLGGNPRHV